MASERRARITWSAAHVARGLPFATELVAPAWFEGDPPDADGWSLACSFAPAPAVQGSPSIATVEFVVAHAPHGRLTPGARLRLLDGPGGERALVEMLV